jgi:hypothetical protein
LAVCVALAMLAAPGWAATIRVHPAPLKVRGFFGGTRLEVVGEIPAGAQAVIEVIGKEAEQELMRKGRRWDLWMNVGEINIQGVPSFYLVASSEAKLLGAAVMERPAWGYERWRRRARFQGVVKQNEDALIFQEFIVLKEGLGLYGRFPGAVQVVAAGSGRDKAQVTFPINTRIAPGTYHIRLTAVQGTQVVQRTQVPWQVEMVGSPAFLTFLALKRPVLYGILAVGLAALVGLLSGILFKHK